MLSCEESVDHLHTKPTPIYSERSTVTDSDDQARLPHMTRFLSKGCRGGMFSKKWFNESAIRDTRRTIRSTVERLRWDHVQEQQADSATGTEASASGGGV